MDIEAIGARGPYVLQQQGGSRIGPTAANHRGAAVNDHSARGENGELGDPFERIARGRELRRAYRVVQAAPDGRAAKVAAIHQRLTAGTYDVSPEQLARKLMGE